MHEASSPPMDKIKILRVVCLEQGASRSLIFYSVASDARGDQEHRVIEEASGKSYLSRCRDQMEAWDRFDSMIRSKRKSGFVDAPLKPGYSTNKHVEALAAVAVSRGRATVSPIRPGLHVP